MLRAWEAQEVRGQEGHSLFSGAGESQGDWEGEEDGELPSQRWQDNGELNSLRIQWDYSKEEGLRGGQELGGASLRVCVCGGGNC